MNSVSEPRAANAAPLSRSFVSLGIVPELARALAEEAYSAPTPIQERAIPAALEGRDLLCCAQTGTGKTAAFVLPTLQTLAKRPRTGKVRALVLTPTRELAAQIGERAGAYGKHLRLRHTVVYGGVGQRPQEEALRRVPDLVIATPGRLLDLLQQRVVSLDGVEILVLDEADRMLDMGFIHDVKRVLAQLPRARQTLFFSATIPAEVRRLADTLLVRPIEIAVTPQATTAETVKQSVHYVPRADKRATLERILQGDGAERVIVFTRTKHGANRLSDQLERAGFGSAAIHGNKSQGARERALESFRAGSTQVLVATDIAARGIDVDGVSLVVNYDLPNVPESYVHRIGRTGRAGARGAAISLCDETERGLLRDIERTLRARIPIASSRAPSAEPNRVPRKESIHVEHELQQAAERKTTQREADGQGREARGTSPRQGDASERRRPGNGYGQRHHGRGRSPGERNNQAGTVAATTRSGPR